MIRLNTLRLQIATVPESVLFLRSCRSVSQCGLGCAPRGRIALFFDSELESQPQNQAFRQVA